MIDYDFNTRSNAEVALEQIRKHGRDRYPSVRQQFIKLTEEVGELAKEVNKENGTKIRAEAADVALALYLLAVKCGFDLDAAIRETVMADERNFRK